MNKIAVLGLGKVGSLVAHLLSDRFDVMGVDRFDSFDNQNYFKFDYKQADLSDSNEIDNILDKVDAVVSCLTYHMNLPIATACISKGKHYFDLTEDVSTTERIRELSTSSSCYAIPQCGLAPGLIGIIGYELTKRFTKLRDVELRVGALPKYPNGLLGYSFTWSPAGVINEYINDSEVIHNGIRKMVTSLDGLENIQIEGNEFEACITSGGLGTLCETLEGKVDTLNYKSIRYPGHTKLMKFLLYELIMKDDRDTIQDILTKAKPPVKEDVVYVYAVVEGYKKEELGREEFFRAYKPKNIDGRMWRAISWTTAASIVSVINLIADNKIDIPKGFVKQEDIPYDKFIETPTGKFFAE